MICVIPIVKCDRKERKVNIYFKFISWYNEDILDKRVVSGDSCFLVEWRFL